MDTTVRIQIDTKLLRRQRNTLIALCESGTLTPEQNEHLDGLINLADACLDRADGFDYEEDTRFAPVPFRIDEVKH